MLSIDAVGHLNPMLAVVSALTGPSRRARVRAFGSARTVALYAAAGAETAPLAFRNPSVAEARRAACGTAVRAASPLSDLAVRSFLAPYDGLGELVREIGEFGPDVVVHDVFDLRGKVAAGTLGIPAVALLPFSGLRALGSGFAEEHGARHPALEAVNDRLVRDFGVDVLGDGVCLPVLFPSRDLSLVTALEEQTPPRGATVRLEGVERELGGALRWVGPCVGDVHWGADAGVDDGFPFERVARRRADGALTVLFSLGTNIATFRRGAPMGGAPSGAAFYDAALDVVLSALGGRGDVQLLIARGGASGRAWPGNVVAADVLPQRRLLAGVADAFITHHGYNSTAEALLHAVPMIAFPGYGDQVSNAEFGVRSGVSVAHWDLRNAASTCTPDALRSAVEDAVSPAGPAAALPPLRRRLFGHDGPDTAARLILGLV
ncbi:hypothetical protein ABZS96_40945 [Streptomyces avermitilis]|uniref:hypothetical protein n=1 Tax=Streptomyces avermitilis TaxID=33903 RepID=UPI0033B2A875